MPDGQRSQPRWSSAPTCVDNVNTIVSINSWAARVPCWVLRDTSARNATPVDRLPGSGPGSVRGKQGVFVNVDPVATRFRLLGAIAKGNMGEVYRAEDLEAAEGGPDR